MTQNPFIGYTKMAYGETFVGRRQLVREVLETAGGPGGGSSIAIIGGPKMGKSSLLWHTLMHEPAHLHERRVLPVWINVAKNLSGHELFYNFVSSTLRSLDAAVGPMQGLHESASECDRQSPFWTVTFDRICSFFSGVTNLGWRVVLVLDEFDAARYLYKDAWVLQSLRELVNNPSFGVVAAVASRRRIKDIERLAGGGSNFSEILHKHWISPFSPEETVELFGRLGETLSPADVDADLVRRAASMCGGHPFLLARFGYEIGKSVASSVPVDYENATGWSGMGASFEEHYQGILEFLATFGMREKLFEVTLGPQRVATKTDAGLLVNYHLIRRGSDGHYRPFSEHFQWFLNSQARSIDLWPLWSRTERAVRRVLTNALVREYGLEWPTRFVAAKPSIARVLSCCKDRREQEARASGASAPLELLDFTNPGDLWPLIKAAWPTVQDVFKKDLGYWAIRFAVIPSVRRPMAHSREAASDADRLRAEADCRDILTALDASEAGAGELNS